MIYVATKPKQAQKNDPLQALLTMLSKAESPSCTHTANGNHKLLLGDFESNQMLDVSITFDNKRINTVTYREPDTNSIWKYEVTKLQKTDTQPFSQTVSELVKKLSTQHPTYSVQDLRKK